MASSARVVLVTVPRGGKAGEFAEGMVEARLAACVNLLPEVVSVYRWRGRVHRDAESLLVVKTTTAKLKKLEAWVKARHPYETPEFLVLPVAGGSREYLKWLTAESR
jgi:periplasmic divalent cation tolerance protein